MRMTPQDQTLPTGRALVPLAQPSGATRPIWPTLKTGVLVGTFGLAVGLGGIGAYGMRHAFSGRPATPAASAAMMGKLQDQVARLQGSVEAVRAATDATRTDDQLRSMRRSVEALKQEIEQVRAGGNSSTAQLAAKIDKADHDPSAKLADIAARLDRMDHDNAAKPVADGQGARIDDLSGRIERLEKQVSVSTATGSIPPTRAVTAFIGPVKPAATAVVPQAKTAVVPQPKAAAAPQAKADVTLVPATVAAVKADRPPTLPGWALRDVYDGMALVEARDGNLLEVQPGQYLPGAGEVRSIERHGRGWVVTTSRGVIGNTTF